MGKPVDKAAPAGLAQVLSMGVIHGCPSFSLPCGRGKDRGACVCGGWISFLGLLLDLVSRHDCLPLFLFTTPLRSLPIQMVCQERSDQCLFVKRFRAEISYSRHRNPLGSKSLQMPWDLVPLGLHRQTQRQTSWNAKANLITLSALIPFWILPSRSKPNEIASTTVGMLMTRVPKAIVTSTSR